MTEQPGETPLRGVIRTREDSRRRRAGRMDSPGAYFRVEQIRVSPGQRLQLVIPDNDADNGEQVLWCRALSVRRLSAQEGDVLRIVLGNPEDRGG